MNCKEARKWISPYLDSELGETKTFEVSEHLRNCSQCTARFEAERRADNAVRANLEPNGMPDDLWCEISRSITTPAWVRSLYSGRRLAIAACLVLALGIVVLVGQHGTSSHAPRIIRQFVGGAPAAVPVGRSVSHHAAIDRLVQDAFGGRLTMGPSARTDEHYDLEITGALERTDDQGWKYVEFRLDCCGQLVMLVLARRRDGRLPPQFNGVPLDKAGSISTFDGVNLAARNLGDVLAVVASRHAISHIIDNLSFQRV